MSTSAAHNRLGLETSPYLLQHAQDPVHWFAWGEQAFAAARLRQRPILLSVGYATCHWCHVMGRESFASAEVAATINAHYVAIKVDREELPDVDAVYMAATQAMNAGRGGWPMTVLLTPELEPFFAGTYLPPHDRGGALGLVTLLRHVAELWARSPAQLREDATALTAFVRAHHGAGQEAGEATGVDGALQARAWGTDDAPPGDTARTGWVQRAAEAACEAAGLAFDAAHGGFGPPPKFLATPTLRLLLRRGYVDGDAPLRPLVARTLHGMARGGLWDWVVGGFCRYSTDAAWRVPHFEKMAYDNACMVLTLLEAHQATGEPRWASLAAQTLRFVAAELTRPEGAFCSAIDADSEHEEGRFATWSAQQARAALRDAGASEAQASAWLAALGVHEDGNWAGGRNVLYATRGLAPVGRQGASPFGPGATVEPKLPELEAQAQPLGPEAPPWSVVRAALAAVRARRVQPITDDKVLAGQNGLLIEAFARGAAVLGDQGLLARARAAADFVWRELWRPDGLRRSWRGVLGCARGALEDYAFLARAFVALYEAGAPLAYLERACSLADRVDATFGEPRSGALYDSPHGERHLLFRPRTGHDGATPSPAATMAWVWRRLHEHRGASRDAALAERTERALRADALRRPEAHATLLAGSLDARRPPAQLVWLGEGPPLASPLWRAAHRAFLPHVVFAHGPADGGPDGRPGHGDGTAGWPLLQRGPSLARADALHGAVYVCASGRCGPPVTTLPALGEALAELGGRG